jgi:Double zinc ribbon
VEVVFFSMETAGAVFFAAVWFASIGWTVKDATRRCTDPSLRLAASVTAVLLPLVGAGLYMLVRPCEERLEVKARRLRIRMLETALASPADRCPECAAPLEPEFRCCAVCGKHVRTECDGCGGLLRTTWTACPWCTKPLVEHGEPRLPQVA